MATQTGDTSSRAKRPLPAVGKGGRILLERGQHLLRQLPEAVRWVWNRQRHWLFIVVPFLLTLISPMQLAWGIWFGFGSPLTIQPFVPFLALSLAWERREEIAVAYQEYCQLWPLPSKKRQGTIWLALLGCLLLLAASVAVVPSLAVLSIPVMVAGILYAVYGWFILGILWAPVAFLLLMTPPGALVYHLSAPFQVSNATALSLLLRPFLTEVHAVGSKLSLAHTDLVITPALSGISVAFPILILTVWLAYRRRVRYFNYPVVLLLSLVTALLVNFVRLCVLALILNSDSSVGESLMKINSWILILLAFLLVRPLVSLFQPKILSSLGEGDNTLR